MAKRKLQLDDFEDINDPIPHASVHGVLKSLSPMKKGEKSDYFEGKLYFNSKSSPSRFVGFMPKHQDKLKYMMDDKKPVHFDDIEVTKARRGHKMEFLVKSSTSINESPKKYDHECFIEESSTTFLNHLNAKDLYEKVTVQIKVLQILRNTKAENGKNIEEVLVADATSLCKCTLWETLIGSLQVGKSYQLSEFYVQEFCNKRSISSSMHGTKIEPIDDIDIGSITADLFVNEEEKQVTDVLIAAVLKLEHYRACMRCKSRVEPISSNQGRCTKYDCLALQRYDLCTEHMTAKLLLKPQNSPPGDTSADVSVFISNKLLKQFLNAPSFSSIDEDMLVALPVISSIHYNKATFQVTSFTH